jgi:demethoxyubiquinone hydroxylase (CLK1/Coq7/Cat5 family)
MPTVEERTEPLNSLLRGELAAVETYQQALGKASNEPGAVDLRQIEAEHREAAELLREYLVQRGGRPATDSGAWGTWARAVEGAAQLFGGNAAALRALKEGEEHGVSSYESALQDPNLDAESKELITATLLPRTRAHIPTLDRFLNGG